MVINDFLFVFKEINILRMNRKGLAPNIMRNSVINATELAT